MSPVLGATKAAELISRTLALEKVKDIRELRPLLQRTYQTGPAKLSTYPSTK
jgi:hypothetical protein